MRTSLLSRSAPLFAASLVLVASGCSSIAEAVGVAKKPTGPVEMRGVWATAPTLRDEASVEKIVVEAREKAGLNAVFLQVRARGDAYFLEGREPRPVGIVDARFDALDAAIDEGGSRTPIHAWINACLVSDADQRSRPRGHVVLERPEWLCVPKSLAADLYALPPRDPRYVDRLAKYATERRAEVEGLFMDPAIPDYRSYVVSIVEDVCRRYDVAGVHLDYVRYPGPDWGYSRAALDEFRLGIDRELDAAEKADMAARVAKDPFVYTRRYARRFDEFRRDAVSRLVADVARAARAAKPGVFVSAAVFPEISVARDQKRQEWRLWLDRGDLDAACPMIYTTHPEQFERQCREAISVRGRGRIWAGIGAWRLTSDEIVRRVETCRKLGADGVVLFSHQGLKDVRGGFDALLAGPFKEAAPPPSLAKP
jgi:uncharacterized lipoprotein YddW (UPF0748 family)